MSLITPLGPDVLAAVDPTLCGDIRSDHAGETGAVMIYRGVLAGSRDPQVCRFAVAHRATERRHLAIIEAMLPPPRRSLLLPVWRIAGFGFLPAIVGAHAVYVTIEAVETFVDERSTFRRFACHQNRRDRRCTLTDPAPCARPRLDPAATAAGVIRYFIFSPISTLDAPGADRRV